MNSLLSTPEPHTHRSIPSIPVPPLKLGQIPLSDEKSQDDFGNQSPYKKVQSFAQEALSLFPRHRISPKRKITTIQELNSLFPQQKKETLTATSFMYQKTCNSVNCDKFVFTAKEIESLNEEDLKKLAAVKDLCLKKSFFIDDQLIALLSKLTDLVQLDFHFCFNITNFSLKYAVNMKTLRVLTLWKQPDIEDKDLNLIFTSPCENLRELTINSFEVRGIGIINAIKCTPNLTSLDVSQCIRFENESLYEDIQKYIPNLNSINLPPINFDTQIDTLSERLQKLATIQVNSKRPSVHNTLSPRYSFTQSLTLYRQQTPLSPKDRKEIRTPTPPEPVRNPSPRETEETNQRPSSTAAFSVTTHMENGEQESLAKINARNQLAAALEQAQKNDSDNDSDYRLGTSNVKISGPKSKKRTPSERYLLLENQRSFNKEEKLKPDDDFPLQKARIFSVFEKMWPEIQEKWKKTYEETAFLKGEKIDPLKEKFDNLDELLDYLVANPRVGKLIETLSLNDLKLTSISWFFDKLKVKSVFFSQCKILSLKNNQIRSLPKGALKHFYNLEVLILSDNYLTEIEEDLVQYCFSLTHIYLDNNCIYKLPTYLLTGPDQLETLICSNNNLSDIPKKVMEDLSRKPYLAMINMSNNCLNQNVCMSLQKNLSQFSLARYASLPEVPIPDEKEPL